MANAIWGKGDLSPFYESNQKLEITELKNTGHLLFEIKEGCPTSGDVLLVKN